MNPVSCVQSGCALVDAVRYSSAPVVQALSTWAASVSYGAPWFFPLVACVLGACAASFTGLVVDRLPRMRGWHGAPERGLSLASPPSSCESCGEPLGVVDLIPVLGWVAANGRCRSCGSRVPWRYPAAEAATGLVSLVVVATGEQGWTDLLLLLLVWTLSFVAWIDLTEHEIPDAVTVPLLFAGLLLSPFEPEILSRVLGAAVAGCLVLGAFKLVSVAKSVDGMSLGDVALAGALGGWVGVCSVPAYVVLSCLVYVAYAAPARRRGVTWTPMGPALCVGLPLVVWTGPLLVR